MVVCDLFRNKIYNNIYKFNAETALFLLIMEFWLKPVLLLNHTPRLHGGWAVNGGETINYPVVYDGVKEPAPMWL